VLQHFAPERVDGRLFRVALHAFVTVTLDLPLDPHEKVGPHGLRTGEAAPDATDQAGDQEQGYRAHDQQAGQQPDILRP